MKILGIETSCDDTAVCLVEVEGSFGPDLTFTVLGNAAHSQASLHSQYGGVFPNVAKREHSTHLIPLLKEVLQQAGELSSGVSQTDGLRDLLTREPELLQALGSFLPTAARPNMDAIAVTAGPGLEPALWVGINFAKALSLAWNIPIVAVNHMEGHILSAMLKKGNGERGRGNIPVIYHLEPITFPLLSLLISGGHTELVLSEKFGMYKIVGKTRDDAAGEAFDKVARMLDLPYPGGPHISRLATQARLQGLSLDSKGSPWKFPRPMINEDNLDFSFSGLKTAVLRQIEGKTLSDDEKRDIAREFEDAVTDVLVKKTVRAVEACGASTVVVGGGVSANTHIRESLAEALTEAGAQLFLAPPELTGDNAIMIAFAGYFAAQKKEFTDIDSLKANGNLELGKES